MIWLKILKHGPAHRRYFFLSVYAIELALRIYADHWRAFRDHWVKFDSFLVVSSVIVLIMTAAIEDDAVGGRTPEITPHKECTFVLMALERLLRVLTRIVSRYIEQDLQHIEIH